MGYLIKTDPDPWRSRGQVAKEEFDTFTCAHHGGIVKMIHGDVRPGRQQFEVNIKQVTWCRKCVAPICDVCRGFDCTPLEQRLQNYEKTGNPFALVGFKK